ncbi:MAG: ImmA/IrrE family metallo-endopeptidase [Pseudomonadota bacterium]|nr:ImmA/IrrE family metallo-endopeptidase [Pseudomonadota bacterium]
MTSDVLPEVQHPGFYIKAELEARGWAQSDLAFVMGKAVQQLNAILSGKVSITADMAFLLGEAFNMPAEFFTNLESQYQLSKAQISHPDVRKRAHWQSVFPIRDMLKRGWIEESDASLLDVQMLRFFEKNDLSDIPFLNDNVEVVGYAARKTEPYLPTPEELVWLYRVRQVARQLDVPAYSRDRLVSALSELKQLMGDTEDVSNVYNILAQCGVRFVIVECLPKAKIDGVCTWLDDQPVIAITTRYDRVDNFWFVLRHEIEHVLQEHGKQRGFTAIDNIDDQNSEKSHEIAEEELLANTAASEFCVPQDQLMSFIARKSPYISEKDVVGFSRRLEVHPAIVVGQLQFAMKKWSFLRKYMSAKVGGVRGILIRELKGLNVVDGWDETVTLEL